MKKQILTKIILGTIIFSFILFLSQTILISPLSAAELNWTNPNSNGKNPYKFRPQDALNSQLIMQVVGCTGVIDKVSNAVMGLVQKKAKEQAKKAKKRILDSIRTTCSTGKKTAMVPAAATPQGNPQALVELIDCKLVMNTEDDGLLQKAIDSNLVEQNTKIREECFNGIAVTLARNQLTAMTRYTMNWVNSGFNGDPMYVRNITNFNNRLEQNVLETGVRILTTPDKAFPYGYGFSQFTINHGLKAGGLNTLDSLTSDLSNFVTDPNSYYSEENLALDEGYTNALAKANATNTIFAHDFSSGGWNAWLALTQRDQNNPLGFTMQAGQYLADQQQQQVSNTNQELLTNGGFLSQKRCVKWILYNDDGTPKMKMGAVSGLPGIEKSGEFATGPYKISQYDTCAPDGYETVTPGTIIKDKVSTYINSPERQLELAKTINDSLNALFSALITKFQDQGLSSLSSEKYQYTSTNMGTGPGSNSINMFSGATSGGYTNGTFQLTRDLGNQFVHNYSQESLGDWDAKNNIPELEMNVSPSTSLPPNVFYKVTVPGKTILVDDGYNDWKIGDRAFWNGSEWQNWRKGTLNPLAKRGVLQIQKDYVVVAKELLMTLPSIMPKIGKLDSCIPGPNPSWRDGASDAESVFSEYAGSLTSSYSPGSLWKFKRSTTTFSIAGPGDEPYENYRNIFQATDQNWWKQVKQTSYWNGLIALGSMGTIKKNSKQANAQARVDNFLERINIDIKIFYDAYSEYFNKTYGPRSPMQTQYLQHENVATLANNPAWLPMASEGLDITRNIQSYNDDIVENADEYRDTIVKTNANINSLTLIKKEVSTIIKAAQLRRDAHLQEILAEEAARNNTPVLTPAQYREKYDSCFKEEDISVYDDLDIVDIPTDETTRCSDNLDNDLDGLIDGLDPDCPSTSPDGQKNFCSLDLTPDLSSEPDQDCMNDPNIPLANKSSCYGPFVEDKSSIDQSDPSYPENNAPCGDRTSSTCTSSRYWNYGIGMKCKWYTSAANIPECPAYTLAFPRHEADPWYHSEPNCTGIPFGYNLPNRLILRNNNVVGYTLSSDETNYDIESWAPSDGVGCHNYGGPVGTHYLYQIHECRLPVNNNPNAAIPTITSPAVHYTSNLITGGDLVRLESNITSFGNPALITEHGFCWGTTPSPTKCHNQGSFTTTGLFIDLVGLTQTDTKYYYRGYATNATGTSYTADGTYTTKP